MATGRRSEIVRSDGFKFGNRRVSAARQLMNSVESSVTQKARSSSSERNLGVVFFDSCRFVTSLVYTRVGDLLGIALQAHIARRSRDLNLPASGRGHPLRLGRRPAFKPARSHVQYEVL